MRVVGRAGADQIIFQQPRIVTEWCLGLCTKEIVQKKQYVLVYYRLKARKHVA
jgi:hypothetical protein